MIYGIEAIEKKQRRAFISSVFLNIFGVLIFISSAVGIILSGSNTLLFIISAAGIIAALTILFYIKKTARATNVNTYSGKIEKTDFEVGTNNGMLTVGYGGFVRKRYSQYHRDLNKLTLYIRTGEDMRLVELSDVPRELEDYYRSAECVTHIGGTRFPVNTNIHLRWLCPVCGEFNQAEEHICKSCKNKIIKD